VSRVGRSVLRRQRGEPIIDTQTGGRQMVVVALIIGVPAAWMVYRGREFLDDD
jgi:hypothetical protein